MSRPFLVAPVLLLVQRGPEDHAVRQNLAHQAGPGVLGLPSIPGDLVLQVETVRSGPVVLVVPLSLADLAHRVDPLNQCCPFLLCLLVVP